VPAYIAGYNIPPISDGDSYALELLSSVFSQGESSRLNQRLVKEEQAALVVFSQLQLRLGPGVLFFIALPNQGVTIERIEALVDEEVEKLKNEGVGERELQKAKNQLRSNQIMGRQTVFSKASELQRYRYYYGDVSLINENLDRYMDVSVEDIRRVARKYLAPANRTVVIVVPAAGSETPK
jgi:predicted Zn-dependent peptidase